MKTTLTLAATLLALTAPSAFAEGGGMDDGKGTLGMDLMDFKEVTDDRLLKLNQKVIKRMRDLGVAALPELAKLTRELNVPILEMTEDVHRKASEDPGDWKVDGFLYGYTELRSGAPTLIYPIALQKPREPKKDEDLRAPQGLSDVQIQQLLLHEALHRTLPRPLNRIEELVVTLTRILLLYDVEQALENAKETIDSYRSFREKVYIYISPSVTEIIAPRNGWGEDNRYVDGESSFYALTWPIPNSRQSIWYTGSVSFPHDEILKSFHGLQIAAGELLTFEFTTHRPTGNEAYYTVYSLDLGRVQTTSNMFRAESRFKIEYGWKNECGFLGMTCERVEFAATCEHKAKASEATFLEAGETDVALRLVHSKSGSSQSVFLKDLWMPGGELRGSYGKNFKFVASNMEKCSDVFFLKKLNHKYVIDRKRPNYEALMETATSTRWILDTSSEEVIREIQADQAAGIAKKIAAELAEQIGKEMNP